MSLVRNSDDARRALDAAPCGTCGGSRFVREAELTQQEAVLALRYRTCAGCGAARDACLPLHEDFARRLAGRGPYTPEGIDALAPLVAEGFPAYASQEEQCHARASVARTDPSGVSAGEGWRLVTWLRGSTGFGQGRYTRSDGTRALVTFTPPQSATADELLRRLRSSTPGVAPLLAIEVTRERAVMIEAEPPGVLLATPMFPAPPEIALRVLEGVLRIVAGAVANGEVLAGIRPELVYVGSGLTVTGVTPRAERLARTATPARDLVPPSPFESLYGAPELVTGGAPSPAADVYSACALFLYAASRRAPFAPPGASMLEQLVAMQTGESTVAVPVGEPLATLLRAGLARDPRTRPSAEELLAALSDQAPEDAGQRAEYERELAHYERTRRIAPSKLVK
jgi:hypothetical protein